MEVMADIPVGWLRPQDEQEGGGPTGAVIFYQAISRQRSWLGLWAEFVAPARHR
jgi:hypothetical protein